MYNMLFPEILLNSSWKAQKSVGASWGSKNGLEMYNKGNKPVQVIYRYIPVGEDDLTHPGLEAMGPDRNQLPIDRNVTFFFSYTEGDGSNVIYIDLFLIPLHVIPRNSMPYIKVF